MKKFLKNRVLGQDHVADLIADYIAIGEHGLSYDTKPKGAFLFTGPTGTGKTETAKAISDFLQIPLIRFDMSEFKDCEKWLEAFAGRLSRHPENGIILLDEIEKGDLTIFDYFLQLLDEASITYHEKIITVNQYYIIMTSNIGSREICGQSDFLIAKRIVETKVRSYFRPEFLGRIGQEQQICFRPLSYDVMHRITAQKVNLEISRLRSMGYDLTFDEDMIPFLMNEGISPEFGARPVMKVIHKYIALALIAADKKSGKLIVKDGTVILL